MICPLCAARVDPEVPACPACGVGLREYAQVHYAPDIAFNEALRYAQRGQWAVSGALLAYVARARPRDVQALALWAATTSARGDDAEAGRILLDALAITDTPELRRRCAATLATAEAPARPAAGGGGHARGPKAAGSEADRGASETADDGAGQWSEAELRAYAGIAPLPGIEAEGHGDTPIANPTPEGRT